MLSRAGRRILGALVAASLLTACSGGVEAVAQDDGPSASGRTSGVGFYKVGRPYKVNGQLYTPAAVDRFEEVGVASWYGPKFHGKQTANGEIFNRNALTAAHRTLQMPSVVKVTNLDNGKSVMVRVNDRGPFSKRRVIDLSERAATLLGFKKKGTARVKVELEPKLSRDVAMMARNSAGAAAQDDYLASYMESSVTQTAGAAPVPPQRQYTLVTSASPSNIYVQAGAFRRRENAEQLRHNLATLGPTKVEETMTGFSPLYRVQLGPLQSQAAAASMLNSVISSGYETAHVVFE